MPVMEHLAELRRRLIISLVAVALGGVVAFVFYGHILAWLTHPYCQVIPKGRSCALFVNDPLQPFVIRLKIAGWGGLFLASPVVLLQTWRFVTPGLNPNEKKYAVPFVISSILLFGLGAAVAILTFPKALQFLIYVGGTSLVTIFTPTSYLRLIILMILAFGIAFEFPILLVFLELAGVLTSRRLSSWRRQAIVVIFIVAAVITPSQDPFSLFAMAIPMCLFYEGAILVGRLLKR